MISEVVLFVFALIWTIFASIEDLRTREISNWLNYSFVIFVLAFRFFYSIFVLGNFSFFYFGLIGYLVFLILGVSFYYLRLFAGGDAKLFAGMGVLLPFGAFFYSDLKIAFLFIFLFLIVGSIYGLIFSAYLSVRNWQRFVREYKREFNQKKRVGIIFIVGSLIFLIFSFYIFEFFYLAVLIFLFPYLYFYFKSVDEVCMVKKISPSELTPGDWLYRNVRVGKKVLRANWDGLGEQEIRLLRKYKKKVLIHYGIPFAPVFFFSILLIFLELFFSFFEIFH